MTASGSEAAATRLTADAPSATAPAARKKVLRLVMAFFQRPGDASAPVERPVRAVCKLVSAIQ